MKRKTISAKQNKKEIPIYKKRYPDLNPAEKKQRNIFIDILSDSRNTKHSLTRLVKEKNKTLNKGEKIRVRDVINGINAYRKNKRCWIPKKQDRISFPKTIFENGKRRSIITKDSRNRSKIGRYLNAVKRLEKKGDVTQLLKFKNKRVRDSDGRLHKFEADPKKVLAILERIEDIELRDLY